MFELKTKELGHFDVAVCGGGIAGVCAAVTAARQGACTILIERSGCLGGTMTEGFIPNMLDALNKGGIVKEIWDFLNAHDMTCTRRGPRVDENGKKIPGVLLDTEGAKYFFDKLTHDAGVKVLFHSQAAAVSMKDDRIESLLIVTECGNYTLTAENYVDATGGGLLADMAGCSWECGDPFEGRPSPASMAVCVTGMPPELDGTDSGAAKSRYSDMLLEHGIAISAQ
ncbi:MAG: FAD-dependent oxidoreductase [Oscillospiraceae bacterium]|nr:FAD-dependent oxidoreductase [Oscillospiraceae bacterium]